MSQGRPTFRPLSVLGYGAVAVLFFAGVVFLRREFSLRTAVLLGTIWGGVVIWGILALRRTARTLRPRDAVLDLRCPRCGFDIRGQLAASGDTCPECGAELDLGKWS